jgi:hypothetical protein
LFGLIERWENWWESEVFVWFVRKKKWWKTWESDVFSLVWVLRKFPFVWLLRKVERLVKGNYDGLLFVLLCCFVFFF